MSTQPTTAARVRIEEVGEVSPEIHAAMEEFAERMPRVREAPTVEHLEEIVASPTTRMLVARDGSGTIVGTLTLAMYRLPSGPRAWIEDVTVLRFVAKRGLGSAMVDHALELVREAGVPRCELLVDPGNHEALMLFERRGFRRMATGLAYELQL